jgi:hypothetical protein
MNLIVIQDNAELLNAWCGWCQSLGCNVIPVFGLNAHAIYESLATVLKDGENYFDATLMDYLYHGDNATDLLARLSPDEQARLGTIFLASNEQANAIGIVLEKSNVVYLGPVQRDVIEDGLITHFPNLHRP